MVWDHTRSGSGMRVTCWSGFPCRVCIDSNHCNSQICVPLVHVTSCLTSPPRHTLSPPAAACNVNHHTLHLLHIVPTLKKHFRAAATASRHSTSRPPPMRSSVAPEQYFASSRQSSRSFPEAPSHCPLPPRRRPRCRQQHSGPNH
jgi:hypothetical protein